LGTFFLFHFILSPTTSPTHFHLDGKIFSQSAIFILWCVCVSTRQSEKQKISSVYFLCVCLTTSGKNKIPFSFRNHPSLHVFGGCHFRAASQVDELFKGKNFGNSYCNNMLEVKTWENTRKNGVFYLVLCEGYIAHVTSIFNHVNSILFASLIT
jgi:hypothetical protein